MFFSFVQIFIIFIHVGACVMNVGMNVCTYTAETHLWIPKINSGHLAWQQVTSTAMPSHCPM